MVCRIATRLTPTVQDGIPESLIDPKHLARVRFTSRYRARAHPALITLLFCMRRVKRSVLASIPSIAITSRLERKRSRFGDDARFLRMHREAVTTETTPVVHYECTTRIIKCALAARRRRVTPRNTNPAGGRRELQCI